MARWRIAVASLLFVIPHTNIVILSGVWGLYRQTQSKDLRVAREAKSLDPSRH